MTNKKILLNIVNLSHSHSQSEAFALILEEDNGNRRLPIIIGKCEAQAIALGLENIKPSRPMTHDLIYNLMQNFDIELEEVYIHKFEAGIFHAVLSCTLDGLSKEIDVRTSDAVALALRFDCDIYTNEAILQAAGIVMEDKEREKEDQIKKIKKDAKTAAEKEGEFDEYLSDELQSLLDKAIEDEDYEKASRIRDELNKRNKR